MVDATLRVYAEIGCEGPRDPEPARGAWRPRARCAVLERATPAWRGIEVCLTERARPRARARAGGGGRGRRRSCSPSAATARPTRSAWGLLGTETALGLVPVGSGNGLARTLRIPLEPAARRGALANAASAPHGRGPGQRAAVPERGRGGLRRAGGRRLPRARPCGAGGAGVFDLRAAQPAARALLPRASRGGSTPGEAFEGRALIVAFVNGRQYGGGAMIAPRARLDDGLLDIVVIEDAPRARDAPERAAAVPGDHRTLPAVSARRSAAAARPRRRRPFEHHRDGEPEAACERLEVGVRSSRRRSASSCPRRRPKTATARSAST